jgi:hypothetical protein
MKDKEGDETSGGTGPTGCAVERESETGKGRYGRREEADCTGEEGEKRTA